LKRKREDVYFEIRIVYNRIINPEIMKDEVKSVAIHLRQKTEKLVKSRPHEGLSYPLEEKILRTLQELGEYSAELEIQN